MAANTSTIEGHAWFRQARDDSGDTIVLGSPPRGQSGAVATSMVMFYTADRDGDGTRDGLDV